MIMLFRSLRWNAVLATIFALLLVLLVLSWQFSGRWAAGNVVSAVSTRNLGAMVQSIDAARLRVAAADDWVELIPASLKVPGFGAISEELRTIVNAGLRIVDIDEPSMAEMLIHVFGGRGLVTSKAASLVLPQLAARRTPSFSYASGPTSDIYLLKVTFLETGEEVTATLVIQQMTCILIETSGARPCRRCKTTTTCSVICLKN